VHKQNYALSIFASYERKKNTKNNTNKKSKKLTTILTIIGYYSGFPIFQPSKGNGNWFKKSGVRKIEGGIKSHLFYRGIVL